ncbi:MBL fold metallo-hydrolase [Hoeflea sp. WL0058]|uniref:MBL fold metallo-hydrolase n=1 Tax=Flavimaribacter sediminis TaxID=2865987 RepID=A0AAE2ZI39_9HYPH|nr:MBL fold metallo-hydrolase [Flavimaribacter sediminis]MBW8636656.1 MBL fold metallo-hydrolase [Flavimaribacter sediminis]
MSDDFKICRACGVEHPLSAVVCDICLDERQYVPRGGQAWATHAELAAEGVRTQIREIEENLHEISTAPSIAIGHRALLVVTPEGNLLWEPVGFLDEAAVSGLQALGGVRYIAASHPHMFGAQVAWSRALGGAPVLVSSYDREWLARPDPVIEFWEDDAEILPGVTLARVGGHFPGSAVVHFAAGATGAGALLSGDSIMANPDGKTVSFMRSFPNRIPLSVRAVETILQRIDRFAYDRLYSNVASSVEEGADAAVRASAQRHIDWITGAHDDLI